MPRTGRGRLNPATEIWGDQALAEGPLLDRCIDLADHRASVSAVGQFPGNDVFSSVRILADNRNGTSHAPKAIERGSMVCIPLGSEHHRRALASLLVEGLRICAVPFGFVEHLDFFTPANHHRVLGSPFAVFPPGESSVGVWRSANDGLANDKHHCCWHRDDHGYVPSSTSETSEFAGAARESLVGIGNILYLGCAISPSSCRHPP